MNSIEKRLSAINEEQINRIHKDLLICSYCGKKDITVHTAECGKTSDNKIWLCPNGMETNSLMLHYICYHRSEVPVEELQKLKNMQL